MANEFSLEKIEDKYKSLTGYSFKNAVDKLFFLNKQACENQCLIFESLKTLYLDNPNKIEELLQTGQEEQKSVAKDFFKITFSFLRKNLCTGQDIQYLIEEKRWESAQSLVRVLIENFINYVCFIKQFNKEPALTCGKYYAFNVLLAVKQWRLSTANEFLKELKNPNTNWNKVANSVEYLINLAEMITSKLTQNEFAQLSKHGFTGKPLEQRAKMSGYELLYDFYRSFSKKIHSNDFFDHMKELTNQINDIHFYHRNLLVCTSINDCVLTFSENINAHFGLNYFDVIFNVKKQSGIFIYNESLLG